MFGKKKTDTKDLLLGVAGGVAGTLLAVCAAVFWQDVIPTERQQSRQSRRERRRANGNGNNSNTP